MINDFTITALKKTAKIAATTLLEGVSYVLDKGAEYADEAKEYVQDLDKKDLSGRNARQEKRDQGSSTNGNTNGWNTGYSNRSDENK